MLTELTTQGCTPPLQDDSSLSAPTGVGLQCVTQTLVGVGSACTLVIHAGSVPRLWRHHLVAGLKGSRFQHLAAGISSLLSLVACTFAGVNVLASTTRSERAASIRDLKWQSLTSTLKFSCSSFSSCLVCIFYLPAVPKVSFWQADLSARHSQVVLVVTVEVPTKTTGFALICARNAHFQMWTTAPHHLNMNQRVCNCPLCCSLILKNQYNGEKAKSTPSIQC